MILEEMRRLVVPLPLPLMECTSRGRAEEGELAGVLGWEGRDARRGGMVRGIVLRKSKKDPPLELICGVWLPPSLMLLMMLLWLLGEEVEVVVFAPGRKSFFVSFRDGFVPWTPPPPTVLPPAIPPPPPAIAAVTFSILASNAAARCNNNDLGGSRTSTSPDLSFCVNTVSAAFRSVTINNNALYWLNNELLPLWAPPLPSLSPSGFPPGPPIAVIRGLIIIMLVLGLTVAVWMGLRVC